MKIFLLYTIVLLSISCRTISKNHLIGTYLQNNDKNTLIIFNSKDFLVKIKHKQLDAPPCAYGDTITYGNWEIENNKMISIDNTNLISSIIESEFQESFKFNDSVAIHINNPIEYFYLKNKENVRGILYEVVISSNDSYFDVKVSGIYQNNLIKFYKPNNIKIRQITIFVIPTHNYDMCNLGERYFYTIDYVVKNEKSNSFNVEMPMLTYNFMSYIRLNRDFIKIINKSHLEWNGEVFSKQPIATKSSK